MIQKNFHALIVLFLIYSPLSFTAQTEGLSTVADSHGHIHDVATAHQQAVSKTLVVARDQGAHTTGQLLSKCTKESCKNRPNKTGVWLQSVGLRTNKKNTRSTPGFKSRVGTIVLGMDSKVKEGLILGSALGYGRATMNFNLNSGKAHIHDTFVTFFGTWFGEVWYMEASLLGSLQKYRVARNTDINNIFAFNHHSGYQLCPHLGGGYIFPLKNYQIRPYLTIDYAYSYQAGHLDTGPGAPNNYIDHSEASMLRTEMGLNLSKKSDYETFYSKLSLQLSAVNKRPLKRGLIVASNGTAYQSSKTITTAFSPGIEASLIYNDGWSLSAFWVGEYAYQYTQQEVFIKFRKTF